MTELTLYLQSLPQGPALRLGKAIQEMIFGIVMQPRRYPVDESLSDAYGYEVRHAVYRGYVLLYSCRDSKFPEFLGVLPGKRDIVNIMRGRIE